MVFLDVTVPRFSERDGLLPFYATMAWVPLVLLPVSSPF